MQVARKAAGELIAGAELVEHADEQTEHALLGRGQVDGQHGDSSVAGLSLPFTAKQSIEKSILNFAVDPPAFAQVSLLAKSETLQRSYRCGIVRIDVGLDPVQV